MASDVTDSTFAAEVLESPEPVLVDFWAPWCGPCRMVAPVLEQISSERGIRLVKLNTDENPETASRYGVMSLPTMMVFKGGQPGQPIVGALPKTRLDAQIADQVSA